MGTINPPTPITLSKIITFENLEILCVLGVSKTAATRPPELELNMDRVADRRFGRFLDHLGQCRMGVDSMSDLICRGLKGHS